MGESMIERLTAIVGPEKAREVLTVMREPTDEMGKAGVHAEGSTDACGSIYIRPIWRAMIDAALEGK